MFIVVNCGLKYEIFYGALHRYRRSSQRSSWSLVRSSLIFSSGFFYQLLKLITLTAMVVIIS